MSSYILSSPIDIYSSVSGGQINLYNSANTFASRIVASSTLTANVDFTLPSVAGTVGQYLQRTGASSLGWVNGTISSSVYLPIYIRTYQGNVFGKSTSTTGVGLSCGTCIFPGTTALGGNLGATYMLCTASDNTTVYNLGIIDKTNSTTIGSTTDSVSTANVLKLTSIPINVGLLSVTPAVWTFTFGRTSGTGTCTIYIIFLTL